MQTLARRLLRKYQATLLGEIRFHDGSHDFLTLCQAMKKDIFFISKGVLRPRDFMVRMGIDMEGINCIREGEVDAENENIFRRISRKFGHDLDKFIYIGEEKDVVKARETGMTGVLLDRSLEECRLECTPFAVQNTMAINSLKILTNWLKW
ncbi:hypothetical protein EJ04DRAFT_514587 [Polyplosphaeria fusca]|uniref:Uncharacterized protein n=1 Tax=Polyplosphaeria fusca TaxID=682080 RepID=A0A9P4UWU3_9PLEO|nr:hypothetical protein EJ04DRAFT_514587 [Polyplosphaeria fusca]